MGANCQSGTIVKIWNGKVTALSMASFTNAMACFSPHRARSFTAKFIMNHRRGDFREVLSAVRYFTESWHFHDVRRRAWIGANAASSRHGSAI